MPQRSTFESLLAPWKALRHAIAASLYKQGVSNASVRELLTRQCSLAMVALVIGLAGAAFGHLWVLHFGLGVGLITVQFYFLATSVAKKLAAVTQEKGGVAGMVFKFYGRLIITASALAVLLVFGQISLAALLAGLSTVVATILIWGVESYLARYSKEA